MVDANFLVDNLCFCVHLTCAMPVTVILTPCEVYTAGEVTVRVMVFSDNLQHNCVQFLYRRYFLEYSSTAGWQGDELNGLELKLHVNGW